MRKLPRRQRIFPGVPPAAVSALRQRFVVPPFSVLDARQGYWQERKRAWLALGVEGALGRVAPIGGSPAPLDLAKTGDEPSQTSKREAAMLRRTGDYVPPGETLGAIPPNEREVLKRTGTYASKGKDQHWLKSGSSLANRTERVALGLTLTETSLRIAASGTGASVFDPVLCELVCRWFCPPGGSVLDPFAGGSTRGIVAEYLGHAYTGIELRPEQVDENQRQAQTVGVAPKWILGDSSCLLDLLPPRVEYDLVWTCPPYYDLEVYSESERDGSAFETYQSFLVWYEAIFRAAVSRLRDNRFLSVTVGEIRDRKTGAYRNFVGDTIACFLQLGLCYYNEAVLVTAVGSLPIRVGSLFAKGRKIGKTHQNVLVFYKGDPRNIPKAFPALQPADYWE